MLGKILKLLRGARFAPLGGLLLLSIGLLFFLEPVVQNGDSAVYNEQVDQRDLGNRTTHFGYILLGVIARALLPGTTDLVMNLMTLVLGLTGLVAIYFVSYKLTESRLASSFAALAVLCIPSYFRGSVVSEVDVPLAALICCTYGLATYGKPVAAGLVYGLTILVSPLAALALPALLLALIWSIPKGAGFRGYLKWIALFGVASLLVYAPVVLLNWQDYVHGGRGILHAPRHRFDLATHARRSLTFVNRDVFVLLPLWFLGAVVAITRRRYAAVAVPVLCGVVSMLFGERFVDVPVQLPTAALFAPLIAIAVTYERLAFRVPALAAAAAAVVWNAIPAHEATQAEIAKLRRQRELFLHVKSSQPPPLIVHARGFTEMRVAERIAFGQTYNDRVLTAHDFKRRCRAIARSPQPPTIWYLRSPFRFPCKELEQRYRMSRRRVGGIAYHVSTPQ